MQKFQEEEDHFIENRDRDRKEHDKQKNDLRRIDQLTTARPRNLLEFNANIAEIGAEFMKQLFHVTFFARF